MKEGTRFWIVRPWVGFGGVSGLGTLLSGAYVEFDPGEGQPASDFVGLAEPPPITSQMPGTEFVLSTDRRGGIGRGAPFTTAASASVRYSATTWRRTVRA